MSQGREKGEPLLKIDRILFPTDFSDSARLTAAFVADLARKYNARIYMLHVIYDITRDSGLYSSRLDMDSLYEDVKKSARDEMNNIASTAFQDFDDLEIVIRVGSPSSDIILFADEADIDLIVIGSHGKKGLDRILFGSTALKVIKRAKCPVLTVRERA